MNQPETKQHDCGASATHPEYLAGLKTGHVGMAGEISLLKAVIRELEDKVKSRDHALEFYADVRRYRGPNQRPIADDRYAPPDQVYVWDITKDHGEIARRAISNEQ